MERGKRGRKKKMAYLDFVIDNVGMPKIKLRNNLDFCIKTHDNHISYQT